MGIFDTSNPQLLAMRIIAGLLIITAIVLFFYHVYKGNIIRNNLAKLVETAGEQRSKRHESQYREAALQISAKKKGFEKLLDEPAHRFIYAGLDQKLKGMTVEIWLSIKIVIAALALVVVSSASKSILYGIMASALIILCFILWESFLARQNYKRVDRDLSRFLNMLGNFAEREGRISGVFGQVAPYMSEPLRSKLKYAAAFAQMTGDEKLTLSVLGNQIEHPRFKDCMRNLQNCAEYTADFGKVIEGSKRTVEQENRNKRERQAMVKEASINIVMILGMIIFSWYLVQDMMGTTIIALLTTTLVGRVCLAGIIGTMIIFGIIIMKEDK